MFNQLTYQGRRFMSALQVGWNAGMTTWRGTSLSYLHANFDSFDARMFRYDRYDEWYENVMFSALNAYVTSMRTQMHLYRHIREIYNPVQRLARLESAKVSGGEIDWVNGLKTGAVPIVGADETLVEAIKQILKWSNWGTQKGPYTLQGAKKGDSFLKVIDDIDRARVRLEVLNPRKVRYCQFDEVGNIKTITIQYYATDEEGKDFIYREEIDQDFFYYWRVYNLNADDRAFPREASERVPNPYGFVPVRHVPHRKEEDSPYGRTSFSGSLSKIIQLNDVAAPTHDGVRLGVDPKYVAKGGMMRDTRTDEERKRDEVTVLMIPKDGDFFPVGLQLSIADALSAMAMLIKEIEYDMPQLALQDIRNRSGDTTGPAIRGAYSDATDLLLEVMANYDQGVISALQMAISVGAYRYRSSGEKRAAYRAFAAYDPESSYQNGELDFYIKPREIFPDEITKERRIQLLNESVDKDTFPYVARELDVPEEDIDLIMASKQEQAAQQAAAAIRGLAQGFGMDEDETDEEEPTQPDEEAVNVD
jgi:hypothetical protein